MNFFISDLHNYDSNIIVYEHRPFTDCEDMRRNLIKNWNNTVSHSDSIFLLGDVGDPEILKELKGKITIILGNHDNYDEIAEMKLPNIEISRYPIMVGGCFLSHEPITFMPKESPYLNIHGHLHSIMYGNGTWEDGNRYFNVSVENIGYKPISESEIIKKIGYIMNRRRNV